MFGGHFVTCEGFAGRTFRRNRSYEIVPERRLSAAEREQFRGALHEPGCAALLRPTPGSRLNYRAASEELVDLLRVLDRAGPLPPEVVAETDACAETGREVALLVLDGVLEVERAAGFAWGRAALTAITRREDFTAPQTDLGRLSLQALRYGDALRMSSPRRLANRLYSFNGVPVTAVAETRFHSPEAILRHLGLEGDGGQTRRLAGDWRGPKVHDGWFSFSRRERQTRKRADRPMYKLYVSPLSEDLPRALEAVVEAAQAAPIDMFKVGAEARGLMRADKLVLYVADRRALDEAASALRARLRGVPAQGVPFTAQLHDNPVLSWGADPPGSSESGASSWRQWIVERLATALIQATATRGDDVPAWRFALERLALEGVDVGSWSPSAVAWLPPETG